MSADKRLVPDGIRDASTEAFNELIADMGSIDLTPLLIYIIDNVTATALPHLAEQFHVAGLEGWSLTTSEAERRSLIKNAIELHRHKGTPWAIENALLTIGLVAQVEEWFEYSGTPGHFRVVLESAEMSPERTDLILSLINKYKNVRSWLDTPGMIFNSPPWQGTIYLGGVTLTRNKITVYPQEV